MELLQLNHLIAITELLHTDRAGAKASSRFLSSARRVKSLIVRSPSNA